MSETESAITVIVSCYKRPQYLLEHLTALESQTVRPEILVWSTETTPEMSARFAEPEIRERLSRYPVAHNERDFGVWGRFMFALAAETEFVCIIDDDQIPGKRWLENCVNSYETFGPGVYGSYGHIFNPDRPIHAHSRTIGTFNPSDEVTRVDILGHCWFMHRDVVAAFWREEPLRTKFPRAGENIHLAHMAQKHLGIGCYVPPQPRADLTLWGADPVSARRYGRDTASIYKSEGHQHMDAYLQHVLDGGFRLLRSDPDVDAAFRETSAGMQSVAAADIAAVVDPMETFILVEGEQFGYDLWPGCSALPFLEKDGAYWGRPGNSEKAILEMERMRDEGATAIVFPWGALWWLTFYSDFDAYLRSHYGCIMENERLVVFRLR